jgi:hypothetical protein
MENVQKNSVNSIREINVFSRFEYHMFYVLYQFVTCLLTLPLIYRQHSPGVSEEIHDQGRVWPCRVSKLVSCAPLLLTCARTRAGCSDPADAVTLLTCTQQLLGHRLS